MRKRTLFLSLAILIAAAGCATSPEVAKKPRRIFFPPPPTEPKLEYINTYQSQHDFPKTRAQRRLERIFGREEPRMFRRPIDIASDGRGKVYIADSEHVNVVVYDLVNYKIRMLADPGVFDSVVGVAVDGDGNVYVSDRKKKKVLVFDKEGKPLHSFGGEPLLEWPVGVAVDDKLGRVYVTDVKKHTVEAFDRKGKPLFSIGGERGVRSSRKGEFSFPVDVEAAPDGSIVVVDTMNARVQIFDSSGKFLRAFGKRGDAADAFGFIKGIGIDTEGHLYITDADSAMIKVYDMEGNVLLAIGGKYRVRAGEVAAGGFMLVSGIDVDRKNGIYVADQMNKLFQVFQYLDEEYLEKNPVPFGRPPEPDAAEGGEGK